MFYHGRYSDIFWFSIPPYLLNIVNFLGYPAYLDGTPSRDFSLKQTALSLWQTLKESAQNPVVRRLFVETMGFEGTYKVTKDYLQPILKQAAISLPFFLWLSADKRSAILVGVVYFLIYILSMLASRYSHRLSERLGGESEAAMANWKMSVVLFLILIPALGLKVNTLAIGVFVLLEMLQNLWRPVQVARFDMYSDTRKGATILSIESQAKSIFTMIMAPLLGFAVDCCGFWVAGVAGAVISLTVCITSPWKQFQVAE